MNNSLKNLVYFIVSVIAGMILIFARFKLTVSFDPIDAIVLTTAIIAILTLVLAFYAALRNFKDIPYPLGLTSGSVRALLAILVLMFFIFLSLIFYFKTEDSKEALELAQSILTTLGTLVIAVSAFYFGSKATEQGSKIANESFNRGVESQTGKDTQAGKETVADISTDIINLALTTDGNKEKWIKEYDCIDIVPGQKKTQDTTHDLNCLVFKVASKDRQGKPAIPPTIAFNSKGTTYNIPTDVQYADETDTTSSDDMENESSADESAEAEAELPVENNTDKKTSGNE